MKRVFASCVRSTVISFGIPEIFLLEVDDSFRDYLSVCWQAVQKLEIEFGKQFDGATFFCGGIWSSEESLAERLLDNQEFVWLDEMPQVRDMEEVQGRRMKIFAGGSFAFQAHDDNSGEEYESVLVSIEDLISDYQTLVLN